MMQIELSLLDLPPPDVLAQYAPWGNLGIDKGSILLLFDLPPLHFPQKYKGKKSRVYRVPYFGRTLPVVAVKRDELLCNEHPTFFLWSIVDRKFNQVAPQWGKLYQTKENTMPRAASSTVAPVSSAKATNGSVAKKDLAATVAQDTAAPPKEKKVEKALPAPSSHVPTREEILKATYKRDFTPMPWEVIAKVVTPEYKAIFEHCRRTGEERTIMVTPTVEFLRAWIMSNGLNRARKWGHVRNLAQRMRGDDPKKIGFSPSCTHFVLTIDRAVANGGHSGPAILAAFYDAREEVGNWKGLFTDAEGNDVDPAKMVKDFEWIDREDVEASYHDVLNRPTEKGGAGGLRVSLVLNAPRESVLKMDDVRLQAKDVDYLEMLPQMTKLQEDYQIDLADLAQISNGLYKRTKPVTYETVNGQKIEKFGTLSKGGRLDADGSPVRALTFLPEIIASYKELRSFSKDKKSIIFNNGLSKVNILKDVIVAMSVLDAPARTRLAKGVCKPCEFGESLSQRLTKPEKSTGWSRPNADWIVSVLVKFGLTGKQDLVDTFEDGDWHTAKNRAPGWDKGQPNDNDEMRDDVMMELTRKVAKITGNAQMIANVELKAARQERANRKASGDTSRKTRTSKPKDEDSGDE